MAISKQKKRKPLVFSKISGSIFLAFSVLLLVYMLFTHNYHHFELCVWSFSLAMLLYAIAEVVAYLRVVLETHE